MVQSKSDFKRNFDAFVVEFARQIMRCSAFSFHGFRVFLRFSDFFIRFMCVERCKPAPRFMCCAYALCAALCPALYALQARHALYVPSRALPVDEYVPPHVGGCPANASDVGSAKVYHVLAVHARRCAAASASACGVVARFVDALNGADAFPPQ